MTGTPNAVRDPAERIAELLAANTALVDRARAAETKAAYLASDIRDIYAEAKGNGFDTKTLRKVIALRKLPDFDRKEQDELLDLYRRALKI